MSGTGAVKRIAKRIAVALAVTLTALLIYGVAIEPRLILDEERQEVTIPGLPEAWNGAQIAVLSDLQVGMWLANTAMAERAVQRVVAARPAAVLLAGDFVYSESPAVPEQVDTVLDLLAPLLETTVPVVAVLGNHDYDIGAADELTAALTRRGVTVLRNEAVELAPPDDGGDLPEDEGAAPDPSGSAATQDRTNVAGRPPGRQLYVVRVGPPRPGRADPRRALAGAPDDAPRVVLMHNPSTFPSLPSGSAPLAVAGHTHCGQIALPGLPAWSWIALRAEERVVTDGFAPASYGEPGNRLFVTCGIGFSLVPIRIAAPPQVVLFELVAASPQGEQNERP